MGKLNITNPSTRWVELQAQIQQNPNGLTGLLTDLIEQNTWDRADQTAGLLMLEVVEPLYEHINDLMETLVDVQLDAAAYKEQIETLQAEIERLKAEREDAITIAAHEAYNIGITALWEVLTADLSQEQKYDLRNKALRGGMKVFPGYPVAENQMHQPTETRIVGPAVPLGEQEDLNDLGINS